MILASDHAAPLMPEEWEACRQEWETAREAGFPCQGCGKTWTGQARCHCAADGCHETFSSVSAFDLHRAAFRCWDPAGIVDKHGRSKLVLVDGIWSHATDLEPEERVRRRQAHLAAMRESLYGPSKQTTEAPEPLEAPPSLLPGLEEA